MHSAFYLIYLHLLELLNDWELLQLHFSLTAAMHAGELHVEYAIIIEIVSSSVASVPYVGTTSNFQCKCTRYCIFVLPSSQLNGRAENISASVLWGGVC